MLSSSESVLFVGDHKEHGLSDVVLVVGDMGSGACGCCYLALAVWYHSRKQGVQATYLGIILLVIMVLILD